MKKMRLAAAKKEAEERERQRARDAAARGDDRSE